MKYLAENRRNTNYNSEDQSRIFLWVGKNPRIFFYGHQNNMKRWDVKDMLDIGRKLFAKVHKQKHHAHHNHDVHFMARELDDWLVTGVNAIVDGSYTPRFLKRHYFKDEMIDQLHLSDRVLQHILLKQLKTTFPYVMNPNCYHLHGPSGVKFATQEVKRVLAEEKPNYIIRADIKSYYKSISHRKLIEDTQKYYDDSKLLEMLERIIINPIETPRGYKNPDTGIALRGPLSQFFSGLYLKPLDDAFSGGEVSYFRYQDDILIFAKTKRSLLRYKQRMMKILKERKLGLSGKKTRIGSIDKGFHFLGIHYSGTQPLDNTNITQADTTVKHVIHDQLLPSQGGRSIWKTEKQSPEQMRIVPHPRTLRKAREQIKLMVFDGISSRRIKSYLHQWVMWWVRTSEEWEYKEVLMWFLNFCWDKQPAAYASELLYFSEIKTRSKSFLPNPNSALAIIAA